MVTRVRASISSLLSEDEWNVLRQFCEKARRLKATRLASENAVIGGRIEYDRKKGLQFEAKLPPEEQILELLVAFRFFYLKKEAAHFPKILNLIGRHTKSSEFKEALKVFRKRWEDFLFRKTFEIKIDDTPITTSLLLDLWLNAYYFHSDEGKGRQLKKLTDMLSEEFAKYLLLEGVFEATKVIFKVFEPLRGIVDKHFGVEGHSV